jgi:hypothetical protein
MMPWLKHNVSTVIYIVSKTVLTHICRLKVFLVCHKFIKCDDIYFGREVLQLIYIISM